MKIVENCGDCSYSFDIKPNPLCEHPLIGKKTMDVDDFENGMIPEWCPLPED